MHTPTHQRFLSFCRVFILKILAQHHTLDWGNILTIGDRERGLYSEQNFLRKSIILVGTSWKQAVLKWGTEDTGLPQSWNWGKMSLF